MDKLKILLVDDETDLLELLGRRIETWGYELIEASDGKKAIEAVMTKDPDIVVLDYKLPDMDGVSVLKEIRKINSEIQVIMFTAHPDGDIITDAKKEGISAFVPKLSAYVEVIPSLKAAIDMAGKNIDKKE